jgi:cellobiose epimerase
MRVLLTSCIVLALTACAPARPAPPATAESAARPGPKHEYERYAADIETALQKGVLDAWYPRLVDRKYGGFGPHVKFDFAFEDKNNKFLIFQTRMTWVAAEVVRRYPARRAEFLPYLRHGLDFLSRVMWDKEAGGFFWDLEQDGKPRTTEKHAYGMAFGIYACAAASRATSDRSALELSMRAFKWLDDHGYDAKNGGYYEAFTREGRPILEGTEGHDNDSIGTVYGRKSMNTHIHVLEALTELYLVGRDALVKKRLDEVFHLVRDRIAAEDGYLALYFSPDWQPIASEDSYGHDIETAYLLLEAADALGLAGDAGTERLARRLVDRAISHGMDEARGGFFEAGPPGARADKLEKGWWTQAEGLNALLLMHERHGQETGRYWEAFTRQWAFIDRFVADKKYGDWYSAVTAEGENAHPDWGKGGEWKDPYHQARALMETSERLRRLGKGER